MESLQFRQAPLGFFGVYERTGDVVLFSEASTEAKTNTIVTASEKTGPPHRLFNVWQVNIKLGMSS